MRVKIFDILWGEKLLQKNIIELITDPVVFLRKRREMGWDCEKSIIHLIKVRLFLRKEIERGGSQFEKTKPHPHFALFYRSGSMDKAFYNALFTMLKNAEYTKEEIRSASARVFSSEEVKIMNPNFDYAILITEIHNVLDHVFNRKNP